MKEAAGGYLRQAARTIQDAADLYFQLGDYFESGLQLYGLALLQAWQRQPGTAAQQLEQALQLMDLRTAPRLRRYLLHDLAFFHFEAGHPVRGSEELEAARNLYPEESSALAAGRGWLLVLTGEHKAGRYWLERAWTAAAAEPTPPRCVLTLALDLVEAEMPLPFPKPPPVRWLDDETSRQALEALPDVLRERWQALRLAVRESCADVERLCQLRADIHRHRIFAGCSWAEARQGSVFDES